ncbi:hypothetical protein B8V81_3414 [Paenibacillus pasadenensis]|uniref:Uncharacterized protein n=1 Tax=Paenibacillus pasadenensis TaxID=217090 RepID=A0A2N5N3S2_9BACL|nr:hypothetical protein B8V81_3414 [Paenibacillus pasadenensis]
MRAPVHTRVRPPGPVPFALRHVLRILDAAGENKQPQTPFMEASRTLW